MARLETRGRARALQALYAWDLRGGADLERIATALWDDLGVEPDARAFAAGLLRVVATDLAGNTEEDSVTLTIE